jgi:N-acetylmuramoyl-L-alanine amidase
MESVPEAKTDVALILKDLQLDQNIGASRNLAAQIQSALVEGHQARDRGVKQALFHVLLGADMPGALVEAGFLSSPIDRRYLTTRKGRKKFALSLATAIKNFRNLKPKL